MQGEGSRGVQGPKSGPPVCRMSFRLPALLREGLKNMVVLALKASEKSASNVCMFEEDDREETAKVLACNRCSGWRCCRETA